MRSTEEKAARYTIWAAVVLLVSFAIFLIVTKPQDKVLVGDTEIDKEQQSLIQTVLESAPQQGSTEAIILLVEFGDFQCPYCKQVAPLIDQVMTNYPDTIRRVWVHLPNTTDHPEAQSAAVASQCALEQGAFWEFHDGLFAEQENLSPTLYLKIAQSLQLNSEKFETCLTNEATANTVRTHSQFARRAGVNSTPYARINESDISGLFTLEQLEALIQQQFAG